MKNINWKVRFNKYNKTFILRFLAAVCLPALVYLGLNVTDLTTWDKVGQVLVSFVSNPYLIGLTIFNALNVVPDPTTEGLADSTRALGYDEPSK